MRKSSLSVLTVFVLLLMAVAVVSPTRSASAAPEVERVGLVLAYTEGQSITIMDQHGDQFTFELDSDLKIVPSDRAHLLAPGVYVTVIAPNNGHDGKLIATGIVIHPHPPEGFPVPTASFTPLPTDTTLPTETSSETPTALETVEETMTATETPISDETATETAISTEASSEETLTPNETPTETSSPQANTHSAVDALVDWLASIFRQLLSG